MKFLGFEQQPVTLGDRERLSAFLAKHPHELSGYTFAALYAWREAYDYAWGFAANEAHDDTLLISCVPRKGGERHLLQPIGTLSPDVAATIVDQAKRLPYPLEVIGVGDKFRAENPKFTAAFDVKADRAGANYVYRAEDLALLHGGRFAKKRNLLAQASHQYSWATEPLRADHAAECRAVLHEADGQEASARAAEVGALERTLDRLDDLGQEGVLVRVEGQPAAFSIFEPQSPDTAVVHFERALRSRKGLYQVVNRETARAIAERGFSWVNREEDLDDPGLRQAKCSYHPAKLADAWRYTLGSKNDSLGRAA